jgi:hypothetical protein
VRDVTPAQNFPKFAENIAAAPQKAACRSVGFGGDSDTIQVSLSGAPSAEHVNNHDALV